MNRSKLDAWYQGGKFEEGPKQAKIEVKRLKITIDHGRSASPSGLSIQNDGQL